MTHGDAVLLESHPGLGATASSPVVVATDGRLHSDPVVRVGRALAGNLTALRIVTVMRDRLGRANVPAVLADDLRAARRADARARALTQLQRTLPQWADIELLEGDPAEEIAAVARQASAKLVVCGRGERETLGHPFPHETALHLIRQAVAPVYAVAADAAAPPRRIVAAVDFSESSCRAARLAAQVASSAATMYLVHVLPRAVSPTAGARPADLAGMSVSEELERMSQQLRLPFDMTVHNVILHGDPAKELLMIAEIVRADLIATGTHGRGFMGRLLAGSVATEILRRAPCSVLTVPRPS